MMRISALLLALILPAGAARAADDKKDQDKKSEKDIPRLGLYPGEPQARSATPSVPFGVNPATSKQFVFDFHGFLLLPAQLGVHKREITTSGQSGTVLHSPPLMAQDLRSFEYTGAIPMPWLQLNFAYGNSTISATTIISGRSVSDALGYYNPADQMGVSDAYLTLNLFKEIGFPVEINVGAYTGRYGAMGMYDAGRYATPFIARTNTIGETIRAGKKLGDLFLILEQGFGGQMARPPTGLVSAGWNDYADPTAGATFVNQVHLGLAYGSLGHLGLHYITAWTQDDLGPTGEVPDGRITVFGADAHVTAGRGGHLYVGATYTKATNAATGTDTMGSSVSGAIEVLNARGGRELKNEYLGPNSEGNGSLTTFGAQYDLSISRLVFGDLYLGKSPDVVVSLFGIATKVSSRDVDYDGVWKIKGGGEVTYAFMSWLAVSERLDHVRLNADDSRQALTIASSRVLFHTDWRSRDEVALQYSYFSYGSGVHPKTGSPPMTDPTANGDAHVLSLVGTFWW